MNFQSIPGYTEAVSAIPYYAAAVPAIAAGSFIGSRLAAGTTGLVAKGVSQAAHLVGLATFSQNLDETGNDLISYATNTKNIKNELKVTIALSTLAIPYVYGILTGQNGDNCKLVCPERQFTWTDITTLIRGLPLSPWNPICTTQCN